MKHRSYFNKAKGGASHDADGAPFFIEKGILAAGWSLADTGSEIKSFDDYYQCFKKNIEKKQNKKWSYQGVHYLFDNLQKGDYVWISNHGTYYVAEITGNPKEMFVFDGSDGFVDNDAVAHISDLNWVKVGTEEAVPGSVSTAKSRLRSTMQRIDNNDVVVPRDVTGSKQNDQYTTTSLIAKYAIDKELNEEKYQADKEKYQLDKKVVFSLMDPIGLEDLVAMWLYSRYGYVVMPSTDKLSTELYEYVMVDGKNRTDKKIYVQTKNGKVDLSSEDYQSLLPEKSHNEVWLVTTLGEINCLKDTHVVKMTRNKREPVSLDELVDFIFDEKNKAIIPPLVDRWKKYFEWK